MALSVSLNIHRSISSIHSVLLRLNASARIMSSSSLSTNNALIGNAVIASAIRLFRRRCLRHYAIVAVADDRSRGSLLRDGVAAVRVAIVVGINEPADVACEDQSDNQN